MKPSVALVSFGQGQTGRRKYKSHLAGRPVVPPHTLRDDNNRSRESQDGLATAFIHICGGLHASLEAFRVKVEPAPGVDAVVGGFGVNESSRIPTKTAQLTH
jgi:hypothetical protein